MIDELMLRDIKNILDKLRVIKSREDYYKMLERFGISTKSSQDEIDKALVTHMMSRKEQQLYKKYLLYKQSTDIIHFTTALNSLEQITSSITEYYDLRSKNTQTIKSINDEQRKIESALRDIPLIRVNTEYNKVKSSYDRYYEAFIHSGMDRYNFVERIEIIKHSSPIIKALSKRKLKKKQKELDSFNASTQRKLNLLHSRYLIEQSKYGDYLRNLMTELFTKSAPLYHAALLSLRSIKGMEIPTTTLSSGLVVINTKEKITIKPAELAIIIFRHFQKKDIPEFDADTFVLCLKDFVLNFYNQELDRLNKENDDILTRVKDNFDKQREIVEKMSETKTSIPIQSSKQTPDERDTFALVYSDTRQNK